MRMGHVGICVSDWKRSLRFYHDVLGFRYVAESDEAGETADTLRRLVGAKIHLAYLEREGVRIELAHYASPGHTGTGEPAPLNRLGLSHLSLRVGDLAALLPELEAAGVRVLGETRVERPDEASRAVFITDPDGLPIELVERPGD